ncbi:MAG: VCBS repeat-containing protein, partial [Deltaproteobacteria bacterium]
MVCAALACHGAAPDVPVAFTEVTDDRMPTVAQADVLGGDRFWGPGAAAGDVDGDGRVDLYLSGGGLYLNRNDPRGFRFERAPVQPAEPGFDVLGAVFADVDRDGDLDLTLCGAGGVRLLANDGTGAFEDVTQAAGIAVPATDVCVETAWGDLDGDGFPDLSVATYGSPGDRADAEVGHLYLNNRDGTFREATDAVGGPDRARRSLTTAFADFDGDGAVDLYFGDDQFIELESGQPRGDLVFLNRGLDDQGRLQLEEASETLGLDGFRATMGCAFGDPARTGGWDLLFSDVFRIWIYHRSPGGSAFEDVTLARGDDLRGPPEEKWVMWGGQFADFDGDGYEDALVAQAPVLFGERNQERLGPVLLRNRGGTFERVRYAFGGPLLARGTLLADLDGDGDDDVVTAPLFGPFRAFVNDTAPRDAVRVRLVGTVSEPGAAGAVVVATAGSVAQQRMVVAGCRPFAEGPPVVDIALAGATSMDLQIAWPSGARQRV